MHKKTVVLGASENLERYSNMAVRKLIAYNHPVVAVGRGEGQINGIKITEEQALHDGVDTVTLYLNPDNQREFYEYILGLKPKRIIFNPGSENDELAKIAAKRGIEILEACTLVMLSTGQY